ncbi:cbl-interacting serine threonine-protein kinase 9 [Nannochloropsis oceanica]
MTLTALLSRRRAASRQSFAVFWASLSLLLLLLPSFAKTAAKSSSDSAGSSSTNGAFQKYYKKMASSPSHVIELDDGKFEALLLTPGSKRSFPVVIYFTATNPKYGCQPCHVLGEYFASLADSYVLANARKPAEKQSPPVIFAAADVDTAPTTIHQYMQLDTVPHVFFFPANEAPELPPQPAMRLSLEGGGSALLEELEERIGLVLTPIPDIETTIDVAVFFALGLALLLYLVLDQWEWTKSVVFSRGIWLALSYLVFMTATGGMIYCLIRTPPPYGVYLQKVQLFMNRDSSDQFVAEGLVMGSIQLCAGLSFVGMYWFASQKRNGIAQWLGINLSLAAALYFLHRLFAFYATKTRWYDVNSTLDPNLSTFLFGNMKKGSGLFRRVLRVTQLWLYEYKDWGVFRRTASSLMAKYVKKMTGR